MISTNNKRKVYIVAFFLLLIMEILIASFVHDDFIRPYIGDMLVVGVVYTFIRMFMPTKIKLMPLYVFLFAVLVELLQYIKIVELLGMADNKYARVLIGSTFDIVDIACYFGGTLLILLIEFFYCKH